MTNHSIAVDAIAHVSLFEMSVSLCSNILGRFHVMSAWRRDRKVSSDPTFEDPWSDIRDLVLMMA